MISDKQLRILRIFVTYQNRRRHGELEYPGRELGKAGLGNVNLGKRTQKYNLSVANLAKAILAGQGLGYPDLVSGILAQ